MKNNYEVAEMVELGKAQDVVLGRKELVEEMDDINGEFGTQWIPALDD